MRKFKLYPILYFWVQLTVVIIWYLIHAIAWAQNPQTEVGLGLILAVRGMEALSLLIISSIFIWMVENWNLSVRRSLMRLLLLLMLYPGAILVNFLSIGLRSLVHYASPPWNSYFLVQGLYYYIPLLLVMLAYAFRKNLLAADQEREKSMRAETLAQQARWMMLRYQVNPHFLFNALNTIRALIGTEDDQARRIVTELSEYFRYSLARDKEAMVNLKDEMTAVHSYLEIQKIRFKDKLQVEVLEDPDALNSEVPVFAVQTLVENGIKYGMMTSEVPLVLRIFTELRDTKLIISVINSGSFLGEDQKPEKNQSSGTGLQNLKARISQLDPHYKFSLSEKDGQVEARLELSLKDKNYGPLESIDR